MGYLYDRRLDDGKGEVKEIKIPLDGSSMHVSQFNREENSRWSWDTDGEDENSQNDLHYTRQDRAKGSPSRH